MHKKHLPILLILLALIDLSLILYIRFISPRLACDTYGTCDTYDTFKTPVSPSPSPSPISNIQYPISLILVGDIMLGREVDFQSRKLGNLYAFEKTMDITKEADLTIGNFESPFFEDCKETHGGFTFCTRPEMIEGLLASGFDVLSIENNHNLNYGQSGKQQTIDLLTNNGIVPSQNDLAIKRYNDITIGFLSFDLTVNNNPEPVIQTVAQSSPLIDVLVVSLHWGVEYEKQPRDWQVSMAHEIIDAGADIIAGHHPHVTQPVEEYKDGLIYYSLGNFIFDQMWSEETKKGMIAKITILPTQADGYKIINHTEAQTYTTVIGQPEVHQ